MTHRSTLMRQSIRYRALRSAAVNEIAARNRGREGAMPTLKDESDQIRHQYEAAVAPLRGRFVELAADDGRDPAWKAEQRALALAQFAAAHDRAMATNREWLAGVEREAAALRESDPVLSPAEESRRLADRMETDRLAATVEGRTQAANILLPEAERLLALGQVTRARIYLEAAERKGATVAARGIRQGLEAELDRTVPRRVEARAKLIEGRTLHDQLFMGMVSEAHQLGIGIRPDGSPGTGLRSEVARASIRAKVAAFAASDDEHPYVDPIGPAPEGGQ